MSKKEQKKNEEARLQVQAEFFALYDIEPYDVEQNIYKGRLLEQCRVGPFKDVDDKVEFFFSRDYDPENNDMDKIWRELNFGDELVGTKFTLVPGNKIRLFYYPETLIKLAKGKIIK